MNRMLVVAIGVLVICANAWADEPSDEAKRAEAHRTVYRRLSRTGGAKTAELGLDTKAAALVDMHLDMQRNRRASRSGRAPRSNLFMGTAHALVTVEDGRLTYRAAFVKFVIDEVSVPIAALVPILEVAVDPKRFAPAGLADEDEAALTEWRLVLISDVAAHGQEHLAGNERWVKATKAASAALLAAVSTQDAMKLHPLLAGLGRVGDDETARKLIAFLADLPAADRRKAMLRACVAGMRTPAARAFVRETLKGEDEGAVVAVLGGVGKGSDEATVSRVVKLLDPGSKAHVGLRHNAIRALERVGSPAARQALEAVFRGSASEDEKYHVGCALVRLGSDAPVRWLRELLGKLRQEDDPRSKAKAAALERLLTG